MINAQVRLAHAIAALGVLRLVRIKNETIRYHAIGHVIGLIPTGEVWNIRYRDPITDTLVLAAVTMRQLGADDAEIVSLFERVVDENGKPLTGVFKTSRIARGAS
jgi:hypothetical protein